MQDKLTQSDEYLRTSMAPMNKRSHHRNSNFLMIVNVDQEPWHTLQSI